MFVEETYLSMIQRLVYKWENKEVTLQCKEGKLTLPWKSFLYATGYGYQLSKHVTSCGTSWVFTMHIWGFMFSKDSLKCNNLSVIFSTHPALMPNNPIQNYFELIPQRWDPQWKYFSHLIANGKSNTGTQIIGFILNSLAYLHGRCYYRQWHIFL